MNFELMWTVHHGHSDVMCVDSLLSFIIENSTFITCSYWIIALPMLAILLPIFMWSDLSEAKQNLEKHMAARAVKRVSARIRDRSVFLTRMAAIQVLNNYRPVHVVAFQVTSGIPMYHLSKNFKPCDHLFVFVRVNQFWIFGVSMRLVCRLYTDYPQVNAQT